MRGRTPAIVRRVVFGLCISGFLLGSNSDASADGCSELNGSFAGNVLTGSTSGTGFYPGDTIMLTINTPGSNIGLQLASTGYTPVLLNPPQTPGTYEYIVPDETVITIFIPGLSNGADPTANYSWGCMGGMGSAAKRRPSDKLRIVQAQGSAMAAQASGAAISGSVTNAIGDAFGNSGSPVTVGPNGVALNFAADPQAAAASPSRFAGRHDEAMSALAYAAGRSVTKSPPLSPVFEQRWSVWLDARGSGWDKSHVVDGKQINVTGGVGYKVTPNLLLGVFGGYEDFRYDFTALSGKLKGDGGTIGGYAAWKIAPTLRWDAMLGWSSIAYDASAASTVTGERASGNFDGSRWLLSTGLTGSYRYAALVLEPSAKVFALWERQDAWTDSLGTLQNERSFSTGRVSLGGRVIAPSQYSAFSVSPYLGFYGDWRFSSDDALPVDVPNVGLSNGWSGRVTSGVSMVAPGGGSLSLGGEYGGIGAGYGVWTANARFAMPF